MNKKKINRAQWKKFKTVSEFAMRHPNVANDQTVKKEFYEMTFDEFKSCFAESALQLTEYKNVSNAISLLTDEYNKIILEAIQQGKDNICIDAIEALRFRTEHMKLIKKYCREREELWWLI